MSSSKNSEMLSLDVRLLFCTRILRLFAYGFLSVILVLYLIESGLSSKKIGWLLALTLLGDAIVSLLITTWADRVGRRKMLIVGSALMILAGLIFALSHNFAVLLFAAIIGVISPSGNEVGPFLSIEQAALSQIVPKERRVQIFAWYNLVGSFAMGLGTLAGGASAQFLHRFGLSQLASYQGIVMAYAAIGVVLALLFSKISGSVEAPEENASAMTNTFFGLHQSRNTILKLSALFAVDAFAGGFVMQSLLAYWFHIKFGLDTGLIGSVLFGANLLAGISALAAVRMASRIGLLNTMVFTHIPSNIFLILVPVMPNAALAVAVLLFRYALSQMDVPTRQAYTMSMVHPSERSAAAGVTGIARTIGTSLSPIFVGPLLASVSLLSVPFFLAGGLKIAYDLALYKGFKSVNSVEKN